MTDQRMGDTIKLVGAMLRLRHNTKFKGGGEGLGLDEAVAPSSVAPPTEHLDFLRLFCSQIRRRQEQRRTASQRNTNKIIGDDDMVAANFAEAQLRALVNIEIEACLVLHENREFWQQRLDRSGADVLNWIEMGPWTWMTHSRRDCREYTLEGLGRCKNLLRVKILSAGALQLHLTQMKQAYVEGTLDEWTAAALPIIRRTLRAFVDETVGGSIGTGSRTRTRTRTRSSSGGRSYHWLASALSTMDGRDQNATRRSTVNDGTGPAQRARWARSQSALWRLVKTSRGEEGRASDQVECSQVLPGGGREGGGGEEGVQKALAAEEDKDLGGSSGNSSVAGEPRSRLDRREVEVKQVDFSDHVRDPREETEEAAAWLAKGSDDDDDDVIGKLLELSDSLVAAVDRQHKNMVPLLLGSFAAPSMIRRNWMLIALSTPVALASVFYMYKHRSWMQRSMLRVRGSFWQFVREHISDPFWGIYNELVHNQPLTLTDANALADSSYSLQRMLEAFIKDTKPNLSQEEVTKMAATADMSVVSREYEKSIIHAWKNFVAGDIVRMMLIQVQFIKRELLIATTAIGQLARENELNLRMMATVPAFLVAWGMFRAVKPVYYLLTSEKSRESTFMAMRTIVLAMERLLNLRHQEGTWLQLTTDRPSEEKDGVERLAGRHGSLLSPAGLSNNCTRQVILSQGRGQGRMAVTVLDELDLGKLMMLVHQLLKIVRAGHRRFPRGDLGNLEEDMAELVGARGVVSVGQQLQIVQRIQRAYKFLLPRP